MSGLTQRRPRVSRREITTPYVGSSPKVEADHPAVGRRAGVMNLHRAYLPAERMLRSYRNQIANTRQPSTYNGNVRTAATRITDTSSSTSNPPLIRSTKLDDLQSTRRPLRTTTGKKPRKCLPDVQLTIENDQTANQQLIGNRADCARAFQLNNLVLLFC
jgi:hypothetical protein